MAHFGDFQLELYLKGLGGEVPPYPVTAAGLEEGARQVLTPEAFAYVAGSAGTEATARANRAAFEAWPIVPRMLRGVESRSLETSVLGRTRPTPVLLAPIGAIGIVHVGAEPAVARAAARVGVPMVLSTVSATRLEEVAAALDGGEGWFQLYWPKDIEVARSLVGRAQSAGFRAIVVTLDTWALAWRPRDLELGFLPMLRGVGIANYLSDPAFRAGLACPPEEDPQAAILHWASMFGNPALTWADIAWLTAHTDLPVLVKGVCHPDDARAAIEAGVAGVVVSNHGGRQIDGARPALACLPGVAEVARAAGVDVLFDSGIRSGSDILKAVALGASAVLVGRPYVYGLALGGESGVTHVLRCLLAELDLTMALAGHANLRSVGPDLLVRA